MNGNVFTVSQLVEAAERDVRSRSTPVQEKTAAALAPTDEFPTDLLSTEAVMAMSKVARVLAWRMKTAEDAMEGSSGVNTGGAEAGKEDSLTPSAETPEQFVVAPKGEPDVSPAKSSLSIPTTTDQNPPSESLTPGASTPAQFLAPKVGSIDPLRALHALYTRAAGQLVKAAQPGGYAQPITETGPMAGPGKPEGSPCSPDTTGGDKPPTSYEAVRETSRQDADAVALADATRQTNLPGAAAKQTTEGDLSEVLKAASADQVKAAAFRQFYATLDPNSKVACLLRDRINTMSKRAQETAAPPAEPTQPASPEESTEQTKTRLRRELMERYSPENVLSGLSATPS